MTKGRGWFWEHIILEVFMTEIQRTVYFYGLQNQTDVSRRYEWKEMLKELKRGGSDGRIKDLDTVTPCRLDFPIRNNAEYFTLTKIRHKSLPPSVRLFSSEKGDIPLDDDQGIGEITRCLVVDDVLIADYNHFGPRASAILQFLGPTTLNTRGFLFKRYHMSNFIRQLQDGRPITKFQLKMNKQALSALADSAQSVFESLESLDDSQCDYLTIEISRKRRSAQTGQGPGLFLPIRWMMEKLVPYAVEHPKELTIKGRFSDSDGENRTELFNLFGDLITETVVYTSSSEKHQKIAESNAASVLKEAYNNAKLSIQAGILL
jgi:hypothetical protein